MAWWVGGKGLLHVFWLLNVVFHFNERVFACVCCLTTQRERGKKTSVESAGQLGQPSRHKDSEQLKPTEEWLRKG